MKFIEKDFPIQYLNRVAMAEGNAKKPIYKMHKWWARRLGSVFRLITIASFSDSTASNRNVWHTFCSKTDLEGVTVLDPFMGGGTTIVEALRLGCKVIGVDINPVAWFVTKKEIEPVNLNDLNNAFKNLEKTAGSFIKQYYRTKCPQGHDAEVMYFFWVKVAHCTSCNSLVRLFPTYELSRREHVNIVVCPSCLSVIETAHYDPETQCPECGSVFNPRTGIPKRGTFYCPVCSRKQKIIDCARNKGGQLEVELYALEGYCDTCGRFFKRVDTNDTALWEKAKREFEKLKDQLLLPRQRIPVKGRSDPRPVNHGYSHFWNMFNERQLLCLSHLLQEILKIPDTNVRELMLLAFSDCLDANNMFCKYEVAWHKISLFFGLHAYHPIERPTENNVWGTKYGRGTFTKCFEKVRRAKLFCRRPYERLYKNENRFTRYTGERIEGTLVQTFDELANVDHAALLACTTSEDLSFVPEKSVDAVITDPPYFDNIQYSELADFFYVWLQLGLKELYPQFDNEMIMNARELVHNEPMGKTVDFFNEGLRKVFSECHRVLKDEGFLIFTFHHNQLRAWENIGTVLLNAGFYISATPVVRSEGKSGFHSSKGNIKYDCVLVCRKRPSMLESTDWEYMKERILEDAISWTKKTLKSGMMVSDVDVFTIVMGKTVEYYTRAFPDLRHKNEPITLREALCEMKSFVTHVYESARYGQPKMSGSDDKKVEQLTLG